MAWCFLSLEEILSAETTFQFNFFLADWGQLSVQSLHSNPSPSVELLLALSMIWILLFMALVLWLVQDLCHTSEGSKAVLYCNPLSQRKPDGVSLSSYGKSVKEICSGDNQKHQEYRVWLGHS